MPLEPCQIEVLDYGVRKPVVMLLVHDKAFPDMMFKIHKNVKSFEVSEFAKRYRPAFPLVSREKYTELLQTTGSAITFPHFSHLDTCNGLYIGINTLT